MILYTLCGLNTTYYILNCGHSVNLSWPTGAGKILTPYSRDDIMLSLVTIWCCSKYISPSPYSPLSLLCPPSELGILLPLLCELDINIFLFNPIETYTDIP